MKMLGAKVCMEDSDDGFIIKIYVRQGEHEPRSGLYKINAQIITYLYKEGFIDENGLHQAMNNLRNV